MWGGEHCVAVAPLDSEPAVGDMLLFAIRSGGAERNVVHRVVEIRQTGDSRLYITRGDNCLGCEYVKRAEIIGRVTEVHRITGFRLRHAIPLKKFTVTCPAYLGYVRLWSAIWPVRRVCYMLRSRVHAIAGRILSIYRTDR